MPLPKDYFAQFNKQRERSINLLQNKRFYGITHQRYTHKPKIDDINVDDLTDLQKESTSPFVNYYTYRTAFSDKRKIFQKNDQK